jgi:hypothetical protein
MPALRFKEVRLPELHLPEMSRDDIVRAIGDARKDVTLDRVDLTRLDPRQSRLADIDLPRVDLSKIDLSKVDLSKVEMPRLEVPKAIVDAGVAAGLVKRRRSRWPYLIGAVFGLALLGFALSQLPIIRERMEDMRRRRAAEGMMGGGAPLDEGPRAFDAAVAVPIEPAAYAGSTSEDGSPFDGSAPLPEGFGETVADESPAAAGETPPQA